MTETERLKERLKDISSMESFTIRQRVDAMLKIDAEMYMELGITSTLRERKETKAKSLIIYTEIKRLDPRENFVLINLDK
jgi:hypothetical protein|tara:strand:+ start:2408 stop:2647 length:240 start_codon:yes stop_codon:yes gene_type:complete